MKRYEVIEHTADVGLAAYGRDLCEAFANAAYGMFSLMTDLRRVEEMVSRNVEIASDSQEELLVDWLNELLYLFDVDNIIFRRFEIDRLDDCSLSARGYGERVDHSDINSRRRSKRPLITC